MSGRCWIFVVKYLAFREKVIHDPITKWGTLLFTHHKH
jgi:hypothetical protein